MQRLQVELIGGLGGDEFHGRTLHRLGDRLRIAEIVFLSFARGRFLLLMRSSPYKLSVF
jgi:hypothetical protein